MENIQIKVKDSLYQAKLNPNKTDEILLNDQKYSIEILKNYGNNVYSFSVNNKIYQALISKDSSGNYKVNLNGFTYEAEVKNETALMLDKLTSSSSSANKKATKLRAPMPGLVVKINVKEGDTVKKGEKIIIVEAMKMENALGAPSAGIVKSIKVSEGQAVEKDAVLIEFE
jgi:biotin carboxyl carrier protein